MVLVLNVVSDVPVQIPSVRHPPVETRDGFNY